MAEQVPLHGQRYIVPFCAVSKKKNQSTTKIREKCRWKSELEFIPPLRNKENRQGCLKRPFLATYRYIQNKLEFMKPVLSRCHLKHGLPPSKTLFPKKSGTIMRVPQLLKLTLHKMILVFYFTDNCKCCNLPPIPMYIPDKCISACKCCNLPLIPMYMSLITVLVPVIVATCLLFQCICP